MFWKFQKNTNIYKNDQQKIARLLLARVVKFAIFPTTFLNKKVVFIKRYLGNYVLLNYYFELQQPSAGHWHPLHAYSPGRDVQRPAHFSITLTVNGTSTLSPRTLNPCSGTLVEEGPPPRQSSQIIVESNVRNAK